MDYPKSTPNVGLVGGKFVDENTSTGQAGSLIPAGWGNAVTDELLAVIKAAGLTPSESDLNQLVKAIQGIAASDVKRTVRVATTGAIALSGLQTIDGYTTVAGDRVLVKDQANAAQNWIYTAAAGAWSRALDANESAECAPGHLVIVESGTANASSIWQLSNTAPPTVGTSALNFSRLYGKTGVVAGSYRQVTVDAQGRVTAGSNPTTLAAAGITDGATKTELAAKANSNSPTLTGTPLVPTAAKGTNTDQAASTAFVQVAIAAIIDSSPAALDTLKELAAAMNNDPNFATTILNALAGKADINHAHAIGDVSGLVAALKAASGLNQGATTQDPNAAVNQVILTMHENCPDIRYFWHVWTSFYSDINETVNRAQIAIQYQGGGATYSRSFFQGVWSKWNRLDAGGPGDIIYTAGSVAPNGAIKANGAALSRTTYPELFAVLGTRYGAGDGSTTFNVPDLRGEFVRSWDDSRGIDAGRTLGSWQDSQNVSHTHAATIAAAGGHGHTVSGTAGSAGAHTHTTWQGNANSNTSTGGTGGDNMSFDGATASAGAHTHAVTGTAAAVADHTHGISITAQGGNEARPRNIALLACIRI